MDQGVIPTHCVDTGVCMCSEMARRVCVCMLCQVCVNDCCKRWPGSRRPTDVWLYQVAPRTLHPPCPPLSCVATPSPQTRDNKEYVSLTQQALSTRGFYFSHTYDLSHSQQRLQNGMENTPNFAQLPLHERVSWCTALTAVHLYVCMYRTYTC